MKRFEYDTIPLDMGVGVFNVRFDPQALTRNLNVWGRDGWECVDVVFTKWSGYGRPTEGVALMKRELP